MKNDDVFVLTPGKFVVTSHQDPLKDVYRLRMRYNHELGPALISITLLSRVRVTYSTCLFISFYADNVGIGLSSMGQ